MTTAIVRLFRCFRFYENVSLRTDRPKDPFALVLSLFARESDEDSLTLDSLRERLVRFRTKTEAFLSTDCFRSGQAFPKDRMDSSLAGRNY